jgi:hypothetical protein
VSMRRRLAALEEHAMSRRRVPEPMPRQSDSRRYMMEHLRLLAAWRRGELGPEEAAQVEAMNAAVERQFAKMRGEGDTY